MINLEEYRLDIEEEWESYIDIFDRYLREESRQDGFEYSDFRHNDAFRQDMTAVAGRKENRLHICRIMLDGSQIGFIDYVCWPAENGKCLIGNFFVSDGYRNHGYGSAAYDIAEERLREAGGKYIDITPSRKALGFYLRKGFFRTDDISNENGEIAYRKRI